MQKKEYNKDILKNNLIHLRKKKNLSQRELSEEIGIKRCTIAKYEEPRGNVITIENLIKYCNFFKISVDKIVTCNLSYDRL